MNKILFTGGGSAGHVSVNVALIPEFKKNGYQISYIGSKKGIEKEMIEKISGVEYHEISSGKLRRYFSWENFIDPFKVLKGIIDSIFILKKEKPEFVFSKGGFVSVPVCLAARILKIPVVLHESDLTPGLANKINIRFSNHIFTTFEDTLKYVPILYSELGLNDIKKTDDKPYAEFLRKYNDYTGDYDDYRIHDLIYIVLVQYSLIDKNGHLVLPENRKEE